MRVAIACDSCIASYKHFAEKTHTLADGVLLVGIEHEHAHDVGENTLADVEHGRSALGNSHGVLRRSLKEGPEVPNHLCAFAAQRLKWFKHAQHTKKIELEEDTSQTKCIESFHIYSHTYK